MLTRSDGIKGFVLRPSCTAVLSYKGLGVSASQPSCCSQSEAHDQHDHSKVRYKGMSKCMEELSF